MPPPSVVATPFSSLQESFEFMAHCRGDVFHLDDETADSQSKLASIVRRLAALPQSAEDLDSMAHDRPARPDPADDTKTARGWLEWCDVFESHKTALDVRPQERRLHQTMRAHVAWSGDADGALQTLVPPADWDVSTDASSISWRPQAGARCVARSLGDGQTEVLEQMTFSRHGCAPPSSVAPTGEESWLQGIKRKVRPRAGGPVAPVTVTLQWRERDVDLQVYADGQEWTRPFLFVADASSMGVDHGVRAGWASSLRSYFSRLL